MVYAADGANITSVLVRPTYCEVCGGHLGTGSWWVTEYPKGVHTHCRDWSTRPFPLERQLTFIRKMTPRLEGEAAECVRAAGEWLRRRQTRWPAGGAEAVDEAFAMLRRLRTKLSVLGVDQKMLNKL